ncbi:MAG: BatA domain-containing protein [Acidobacteriota bacterium]|nr:BatA domain-containing protein [Acidobacteriota bacterium]
MGISFLAPLFLGALALLAIPIVIHLQRRNRSRVVAFPSLMFLRQIEKASVRRRRIRHWSLLMLRLAALLLLVMAFARPLLDADAPAASAFAEGRERVVVLDASYSMGFDGRWDRAKRAARDAFADLAEGEAGSLIVFSDRATVRSEATTDLLKLDQILAAESLSPRGTRFAPALKLARKLCVESKQPRQEVVLISDLQRIGWDRSEDVGLPPGVEVSHVDVAEGRTAASGNFALSGLVLERDRSAGLERIGAQVRVHRRGGEGRALVPVTLMVDGRELQTLDVDLSPEGSELVAFSPFSVPPGIGRITLEVTGDSLEFDNKLFFVVSRGQTLSVLLVDQTRRGSQRSGLFVQQALGLGQEPAISVTRRSPTQWARADLEQASVVVLSDVAVSAEQARDLRSFVEEGGGVFLALGNRSEGSVDDLAAAGLMPCRAPGASRRSEGTVVRLSYLDRQYPGFKPFEAPRTGDFGTARFFRYEQLEAGPGDRVLARFEEGQPALLEREIVDGRVFVWASTLDTYWNNFALQPVFLPFVHQAVKSLAGFRPPAPSQTVGEVVDLADLLAQGKLLELEALTVAAPSGDDSAAAELLQLDEHGFYEIGRDGDEIAAVAANVDPRESDLTALDPEEFLAALSVSAAEGTDLGDVEEVSPGDRERAQGLWRFLILAGLFVLLGEVLLANRLSAFSAAVR